MAEHTMVVDDGGGRQKRVPVDYPSNSYNKPPPKPESSEGPPKPPNREKIVTGKVRRRQKDSFFAETASSVWKYVLTEVVIPSAKALIVDMMSAGSERAVYGDARPPRGHGQQPYSYNRPVQSRPVATTYQGNVFSRQNRAIHNFGEIVLESRDEAENIIDTLREIASQFGQASVQDLLSLCGIEPEFTDGQWGWNEVGLRDAGVRQTRGGYLLRLPRTLPITNQ